MHFAHGVSHNLNSTFNLHTNTCTYLDGCRLHKLGFFHFQKKRSCENVVDITLIKIHHITLTMMTKCLLKGLNRIRNQPSFAFRDIDNSDVIVLFSEERHEQGSALGATGHRYY